MTAADRRHWQRGWLRLERQGWVLVLRDGSDTDGRRPRRRIFIGSRHALPTRTAARAAADSKLRELGFLESAPGRSLTVKDLAAAYETDAIPLMKRSARASTRSILSKHIVPALGKHRLAAITGRVPQRFVTDLAATGLAKKTVRNITGVLSRMLLWARQLGYQAPRLDHKLLKWPADDLDHAARFFTPEECARIVAKAPWPWRAYFALLAFLGLRAGEGLGLTWAHVRADLTQPASLDDVVLIRQSAVLGRLDTLKSRNSRADLPLSPTLKTILAEYRAHQWTPNRQDLLFANDDGEPYWSSTVRTSHLYPLLDSLGIRRGGLHAFRHGAASALFVAGADAATVKSVLRHGDLRTTQRYVHTRSTDQRRAVDSLASLISGDRTP